MNHIDVVAAEDDVGHCLGIQMEWWCGVSLSYSNVRCIFNVNQYCKEQNVKSTRIVFCGCGVLMCVEYTGIYKCCCSIHSICEYMHATTPIYETGFFLRWDLLFDSLYISLIDITVY